MVNYAYPCKFLFIGGLPKCLRQVPPRVASVPRAPYVLRGHRLWGLREGVEWATLIIIASCNGACFSLCFFFFLPSQKRKPVTGRLAQMRLAKKARIFPGRPNMAPV